jgi:hypothetical protein
MILTGSRYSAGTRSGSPKMEYSWTAKPVIWIEVRTSIYRRCWAPSGACAAETPQRVALLVRPCYERLGART